MGKYIFILSLLATFLAFGQTADAQNCRDYEKKCQSAPKGYKESSLSRSFAMRKMKKVRLNTTFLGEREYHVSVCGRGKLGKMHIKVLADDAYKTVLYDNAADNFQSDKVFEINETVKVIIEITAPHFFAEAEYECAGISIAYKTINK